VVLLSEQRNEILRISRRRNSKRRGKKLVSLQPIPSVIKLSRNTNQISTIPRTVGSHAFSRVCAPCWRLPEYLWLLVEKGTRSHSCESIDDEDRPVVVEANVEANVPGALSLIRAINQGNIRKLRV